MARRRTWTLLDRGREPYQSRTPGKFGGHRGTRIYGRLDCPGALRAIARGGYVKNRVFFKDAAAARAAGFRPCAVCMPREYARWKAASVDGRPTSSRATSSTRTQPQRRLRRRRAG